MKRMLLVMAVGLIMAAMVVAMAMPAFAKITPAQPPSCTNGGGQQPGGQQPTCNGQGLTQNPAKPATNPSGHAPPGQN